MSVTLAGRVRGLLAAEGDGGAAGAVGAGEMREVRMFGGVSFMVAGKMVAHTAGDGSLMVRVDPAREAELLTLPGAAPARVSRERRMGRGWITVAAEHLDGDDALEFWLDAALAFRRR